MNAHFSTFPKGGGESPIDLLTRWLRCMTLALIALAVLPLVASGSDFLSEHNQGYYDDCGTEDQCCLKLTFTATRATETLTFKVLSDNPNADPDCFDWGCLETQTGGTYLGNGEFEVTFYSNGTYTFWLCPNPGDEACAREFSAIDWESVGNAPVNNFGVFGLYWNCGGASECGQTCDIVKVYDNGTNIVICVTRNQSSSTDEIKLKFSPPLGACNDPSIGYPRMTWPSNWTKSGVSNSDSLVFTPISSPAHDLQACRTWCMSIPKCVPTQNHTVKVITDDEYTSDQCNQNFSYSFKIAADGNVYLPDGTRAPSESGELHNFPNPLTTESSFKTTIPFTADVVGEAKITIFNEAGQIVTTETMEVTTVGKHFFYFSGATLPAGSYYYTIESPLGVAKVKRSLLIVK